MFRTPARPRRARLVAALAGLNCFVASALDLPGLGTLPTLPVAVPPVTPPVALPVGLPVGLPVELPVTPPIALPELPVPPVALPPVGLPPIALPNLPLPPVAVPPVTLPNLPVLSGPGGLLEGLGRIGGNLGTTLGQFGNLLGGLGNTLGTLGGILGGTNLQPTPGTESFDGTLSWQGLARTWVGIRPTGAPRGAPMLILLHSSRTSPQETANLTQIGRLAADYGAWIYLPASIGGTWNDDPTKVNPFDDVGFLNAMLDQAIASDQVDAKRVYVAGYSNGGFMAERLTCESSPRIAGLATVSASLRETYRTNCHLAHHLPVVQFHGTADPVVPYTGIPRGVTSAPDAIAFFAAQGGCDPAAKQTVDLPRNPASGPISVTLTRYTGCPADALAELYTVNGGGHTWPGAKYPVPLGATTYDVDATLVLWQKLIGYSLP